MFIKLDSIQPADPDEARNYTVPKLGSEHQVNPENIGKFKLELKY